MARLQGGGDDGDGRHHGDTHCTSALCHDGNRKRYSNEMATTLMDGRNSNSNGRRDGNGDGQRNGNGDEEATKSMDSTTATAMAMDGATATQWRQTMVTQQQQR
jgi:hypothetical protein